ncbi:MAG: NAD(P)-dependent oxidoreductase [Actinobacteria bacterium]|nr:NAD(P)-dependent oxidoreductase [Actinomycetota bacterium]
MPERFLVTGALGCIGAWVCRTLVEEGVPVVAFDLGASHHRHELVMTPEQSNEISFVAGDITDLAGLERALDEHEATHVVHLAAMLIPLAKADPPRGALVNVVGTQNVFEAVRRRRGRILGLAYASSAAVYDASAGTEVPEDAAGHPVTLYGVHKQANEGAARVLWLDDDVPSLGLRPYIVYGPGRDGGLTAAPTLAMAAAARGESYRIPFGGRAQYHYAPEAARAFVEGARSAREGAVVRNLGGPGVGMDEIVRAIEAAVPAAGITYDAETILPFPERFESSAPLTTPLERGVRETVELLRGAQDSETRTA